MMNKTPCSLEAPEGYENEDTHRKDFIVNYGEGYRPEDGSDSA